MGVDLDQENQNNNNNNNNYTDFTPYVCSDIDEPETRESMVFNFNGTHIKTTQELCLAPKNNLQTTKSSFSKKSSASSFSSWHVVAKQCTGRTDQTWSIKSNGIVIHPIFKRILAVASGPERLFLVDRDEIDTDEHILVKSHALKPMRRKRRFVIDSDDSSLELRNLIEY